MLKKDIGKNTKDAAENLGTKMYLNTMEEAFTLDGFRGALQAGIALIAEYNRLLEAARLQSKKQENLAQAIAVAALASEVAPKYIGAIKAEAANGIERKAGNDERAAYDKLIDMLQDVAEKAGFTAIIPKMREVTRVFDGVLAKVDDKPEDEAFVLASQEMLVFFSK